MIITCATIIQQDKKTLVVQESKIAAKGKWNLPGGRVYGSESLRECAKREVLEETGLEVKVGRYVGVFQRVKTDEEKRNLLVHVFEGSILGGKISVSDEHPAVEYKTLSEIDELEKDQKMRSEYIALAIRAHASGSAPDVIVF